MVGKQSNPVPPAAHHAAGRERANRQRMDDLNELSLPDERFETEDHTVEETPLQ